jgi:hypothetical protein
MVRGGLSPVLVIAFALAAEARQSAPAGRTPGTRLATAVSCQADLGLGVKSKRTFCDVIIGGAGADSVLVSIPTHTGAAILFFDLHNRFSVPVVSGQPALAYARHEAVVEVRRPTGEPIGRAAVIREFRTVADLFDQIAGGGRPGGVKAVAPGPSEAVRMTIPPGVASVGIAGIRLRAETGLATDQTFDTPGRPVAIVSNVRVEYRPR